MGAMPTGTRCHSTARGAATGDPVMKPVRRRVPDTTRHEGDAEEDVLRTSAGRSLPW